MDIDIDKLEYMAQLATSGPWKNVEGWVFAGDKSGREWTVVECSDPDPEDVDNAAYIAAANPEVVLELIRQARELRDIMDHQELLLEDSAMEILRLDIEDAASRVIINKFAERHPDDLLSKIILEGS